MGLFDKKFCDICGEKIKLLGNKKLEDGNCCKDCASKLSPWFSERRHSTVESIKEQLAYREENKKEVEKFNVTRTIGEYTKILLDENSKKFMVTSSGKWREANPDVLDFSVVTGCDTRIDESKIEQKTKDAEGKQVSYNPPRYKYYYNFHVTIHVNNPYFDDMEFNLNSSSVEEDPEVISVTTSTLAGMAKQGQPVHKAVAPQESGKAFFGGAPKAAPQEAPKPAGKAFFGGASSQNDKPAENHLQPKGSGKAFFDGVQETAAKPASQVNTAMKSVGGAILSGIQQATQQTVQTTHNHGEKYYYFEQALEDVKEIFTGVREAARIDYVEANTPKVPVKCPSCGATTTPTDSNCCEFCGCFLG